MNLNNPNKETITAMAILLTLTTGIQHPALATASLNESALFQMKEVAGNGFLVHEAQPNLKLAEDKCGAGMCGSTKPDDQSKCASDKCASDKETDQQKETKQKSGNHKCGSDKCSTDKSHK